MPVPAQPTLRFGEFELDVAGYALRKAGRPVRIEPRAMDLLLLLVERRRELVSRADIEQRLWGARAFVDVEMGINTAVRKIRRALDETSGATLFIETVSGKGYRFVADVRAVEDTAYAAGELIRLAVLPFEHLASQTEHEYLADGLTEEAIVALGQVDPDRLVVVGRTAVMPYRKTTKSPSEIGRELGAEYLVEGSVRTEGERVRITARLIHARDQTQRWSASYDNEPRGMLEFQRELSIAIAEAIHVRISAERFAALGRRKPQDAEAYDLYLRGRYFWNQLTPPAVKHALDYYRRATLRDPSYALAWSGIADSFTSMPINSDAAPRDVADTARGAVERAVAAQPDLAEVRASSGAASLFLGLDLSTAEADFRRAIALDPSYAFAQRMLGVVLSHSGRHDEARPAMRRARELDVVGMHFALSAMIELHARDFSAALEFARQAVVVAPNFWIGHYHLGQVYEQLGEDERALDVMDTAGRLVGGNSKVIAVRGYIFGKLGRTGDAEQVLKTLEAISLGRYYPPYATALVLAGLSRFDEALAWLERAYDARDVHLLFLTVDPKWDALRADRRFTDLLERCGFAAQRRTERSPGE